MSEGGRIMVVCNACRYCEGYCAVFQAMEKRVAFPAADMNYLANLCHNCGECLYACQYAPPHEFNINVPRALARIRLASYEQYAWPRFLARAFRTHSVGTSLAVSAVMIAVMYGAAAMAGSAVAPGASANFYAVLPHQVMVGLFGAVFTFVLAALAIGVARFRRDLRSAGPRLDATTTRRGTRPTYGVVTAAVRDALTLENLHGSGADCTYHGEESRTPWRRWFHHCTFYGFLLCFASTAVAAIYHQFGWLAPYGYGSAPVILGSIGGFGLLIGPAGLYGLGLARDAELTDPVQQPIDRGFILLLFLTSLTGLVLLVLRAPPAMPALLVIHLGVVLALFVTMPYGKFVHGFYRTAALVQHHTEKA
jgi:citrate/tricarballylate utilization protein